MCETGIYIGNIAFSITTFYGLPFVNPFLWISVKISGKAVNKVQKFSEKELIFKLKIINFR